MPKYSPVRGQSRQNVINEVKTPIGIPESQSKASTPNDVADLDEISINCEPDDVKTPMTQFVQVVSRSTSPFDENVVNSLYDSNLLNTGHQSTTFPRSNEKFTLDNNNNSYQITQRNTENLTSPNSPSIHRLPNTTDQIDRVATENVLQPSVNMMNSMAKLIDAVGDMMSTAAESATSARKSQKRRQTLKSTVNKYSNSAASLKSPRDIENLLIQDILKSPQNIKSSDPSDVITDRPMTLTKSSVMNMILTKLQVCVLLNLMHCLFL